MSHCEKNLTAKRLLTTAQGWSEATTLGTRARSIRRNPDRVASERFAVTQRRCFAATLGVVMQAIRGCLLVAAILFLAYVVCAQSTTIVSGHITDERSASVKGAEVRLRSRSGVQLNALTDGNGMYSFQNVVPGDYILEVNAAGFADSSSEEFNLARGKSVTKDVRLSVDSISESVTVTANGTPQRADDLSKAVTIVRENEIETRHEISLPEALRETPGLRVQQQGSPGAITSIRLRGQRNSDTAIVLDGLRVRDSADINGSVLPFIPDLTPTGLDRVEILRGSGSSIYGTNAIGGVLNLIPKTGSGDFHFEMGFEGGNLASFRERFQGSGGIRKRGGFSFGVGRLDVRRGIDGNDQYGNTFGTGRLQFELTPKINVAANFYGTTSNAMVNTSPEVIFGSAISLAGFPQAIPGVTFKPDVNNPDQGRRNSLWVASVRLTHFVNENWSYSVAYQKVEPRRRNYNGPRIDPSQISGLFSSDFEFNNINNGGTDTLDARTNIGLGRSNLITAGFEFEHEKLFQRFIALTFTSGGATDRQNTYAFFAQDQIRLLDDRLQLSIAGRSQWFGIRQADRPGFLAAITPKKSLTGDAAISYFVRSSGTKLRGHVGNGFRAPSLFERFGEGFFGTGFTRFGDPTLREEQSIAFDAGFDQRLMRDRLAFGVTYFYTRLQRTIDFTSFFDLFFNPFGPPDPLGVGRFGGYINLPGGISRGVEAYGETAATKNTTIRASYTFTNADRFVQQQVGLLTVNSTKPQYVTPRHLLGLSIAHRYRSFDVAFDLNHTGQYIGPIFPLDFTFPGFTKADLFGSYHRPLNDTVRITFFAGAENVFDVKYFENGFRAPGIMARGGVTVEIR